ncbi:MAG: hypothetical protein CM15mV8_0930 [Caudoviricetes sp.]|nr:MAG: hypothetical protein CM15mV8_0930 [Caudoviricetes sp.]
MHFGFVDDGVNRKNNEETIDEYGDRWILWCVKALGFTYYKYQ